jgi:hypothetical protein
LHEAPKVRVTRCKTTIESRLDYFSSKDGNGFIGGADYGISKKKNPEEKGKNQREDQVLKESRPLEFFDRSPIIVEIHNRLCVIVIVRSCLPAKLSNR